MINWKIPDEDTFYLNEKEKARLEKMGEPDFNIVKKWIKSYNGVIDIGAHIGETSYRYSKYFKKKYAVKSIAIDSLKLEGIDFIKIDTEGYVLPVLKGLQDTIVRTGYPLLQIEFNWMTTNRTDCESVLKELGYVFVDKFDNIDFFYIHESRQEYT